MIFALLSLLAADPPRPNVLLILADDMGYSDVGCYGGEIETPHVDALAAAGLRFTRFHNAGRCCPTRASLMTGLHPHEAGIGHMTAPPGQPLGFSGPYQGHLNDRCVTLAGVLREAGYRTAIAGKWHLGANARADFPLQRGFDDFYGGLSGAFNYFRPGGDRGITRGNDPVDTPDGWYATDAFADAAGDSAAAAVEEGRPFFVYLAFNAPHWPLNVLPEDFRKYRGRYSTGWTPMREARLRRQKELGLFDADVTPAPQVGPDWASLTDEQRDHLDARMAAYAGCVEAMDRGIGRVLARLEELGVADDTLVLFLSDNGACQEGGDFGSGTEESILNPPLETTAGPRLGRFWANACNTPFRLYKHFVHEGGACTPLVVRWPAGIPARRNGSLERSVAYLPDVMATCLDVCGATYPAGAPPAAGRSMAGVLSGAADRIHEEALFFEHEGHAAVIDGDLKLVREYRKPWELYDLAADPTEMSNLAAARPRVRDAMVADWEAWADRTGVAYPQRFDMYRFLKDRREKAAKE